MLLKPMELPLDNKMSLFNELMVTIYLYTLIALTDFTSETMPFRNECGWLLVGTVMVSTVVNILKFLTQICPLIAPKIQNCCRKINNLCASNDAYKVD